MPDRRPPLDLIYLRSRIAPITVLMWFGWRPTRHEPRAIRGPCPIHGSTSRRSRSLAVTLTVVYCHVCHWRGDALALYQHYRCLPLLEAAYELSERCGVETRPLRRG